jgi:bisphosphoglycerate-dependent phosphoglycerate mutase
MKLDNLSKEEVLELNIPNAVPIVYDIDSTGAVQKKETLG